MSKNKNHKKTDAYKICALFAVLCLACVLVFEFVSLSLFEILSLNCPF